MLVKRVIDGDTIDVAAVGRVRLLGIDAPEIGTWVRHAGAVWAGSPRSSDRRWSSIAGSGSSRKGRRSTSTNRHLAYVLTEDGQFVNATLVREGLARVSARLPLIRLPELQRARSEAQAFRRGMWGSTPLIPRSSYTQAVGVQPDASASSSKSST